MLQLTLPGVADIYQGTEWWDFSLVDPDNRRPVDYAARAAALEAEVPELPQDGSGLVKQAAIRRLLALRQSRPELFDGYEPLDLPPGPGAFLGFTRGGGRLVVMVPTHALGAAGCPEPPGGEWWDVLADAPYGGEGPGTVPLRVLVAR